MISNSFYALRTTQVVSSPETQAPQNASRAYFVDSQTKRRHFFTFFWRKIQKVLFKYQTNSNNSLLSSGVQGQVDKGNSEIRKVGGSILRRGVLKFLTFWRDLHRCAFAATWLGALFLPSSKQNCEIALISSGEVAQKSFNLRCFFKFPMNQSGFNLSKAPFHWPLNRAYNAKGFAFRVPLVFWNETLECIELNDSLH